MPETNPLPELRPYVVRGYLASITATILASDPRRAGAILANRYDATIDAVGGEIVVATDPVSRLPIFGSDEYVFDTAGVATLINPGEAPEANDDGEERLDNGDADDLPRMTLVCRKTGTLYRFTLPEIERMIYGLMATVQQDRFDATSEASSSVRTIDDTALSLRDVGKLHSDQELFAEYVTESVGYRGDLEVRESLAQYPDDPKALDLTL